MQNPIPLEKDIIVIVPKNYTNTQKGSFFEKVCAEILKKQSYEILGLEVRRSGMEVDIEANHKPSGKKLYVECKFYNSKKIDANIVDLCYAQAFRSKQNSIALFSTTDLGKDAQTAYEDYFKNDTIDYSFYNKEEILSALEVSGTVKNINLLTLKSSITFASLLIHPEIPMTWLFQEVYEGTPLNLIAWAGNAKVDLERIREILNTESLFEGLNILQYAEETNHKVNKEESTYQKEIVSGIVLADDIMDYKPCQPKYFVGRDTIQKEVWDFLESVRNHKTDSRLLSLIGSSGNGKSSLVAYLSERFRNVKWKNKFYLYPVDVRSARGARFVSEAVVKAFNSAINDDFIKTDNEFVIENSSDITSGKNFKFCTEYLETNEKVIVIFFDQFEEVFMKEELFGLFRAFERFALDAAATKTNFVIGFSWRSGITLGEENPAYDMWNKLKDFRVDKKLVLFDIKDSSQMITTFEKDSVHKLSKSLRKRLIQQSQGLPWLLKKLCIHLFKKINDGISQEELLVSQFQIKTLFDEDLDRPDKERACLKYVAKNSPVDQYETTKEFGQQTVTNLISERLLIKTGEKISVYWDVFRDYLITDIAPVIPWSYMPASGINISLNILSSINSLDNASFSNLLKIGTYKSGTLTNIIMDLQSFSLIEKCKLGNYKLTHSIDDTAGVIRNHMKGHIVYSNALKILHEDMSDSMKEEDFVKLINNEYVNKDGKTPQGYSSRLTSWLQYAGLVSNGINKILLYKDDDYSPDFGNIEKRKSVFIGGGSPENCNTFIKELQVKKSMNQEEQNSLKARNTVTDLVTLGICTRKNNSEVILSRSVKEDSESEHILALSIIKTETINILNELILIHGLDKDLIGNDLELRIGKTWKESTRKRNINALIKYNDFARNYLNKPA